MDQIISTFHIDWHLMLAQLFNFVLVALVLWFFVFKPLNKIMAERGQKIEKSLQEAEEISAKLKSTEQQNAEIIANGHKEAQRIIQESKLTAENQQKKTVEETQIKVRQIVEESKKQIAQHKDQMIKEVEGRVVDLVVLASQQVLKKVTDKKIDKSLADTAVKAISKK
ncbi:MAG: F0F1 ATP synthase subunit B [Candidatus Buchananbacteria bacterium]|nr:F0F1 ATP synthase subunit B [Candidatus Buchananbacteria bacterium]